LAHDLPDGTDALARRAEDVLGAIERAELLVVPPKAAPAA